MPSKDYHRNTSSKQQKGKMKRIIIEILVSALLIIPAIVLCTQLKGMIKEKLFKVIELKPGSEGYTSWLNPPITTTRSYHLFNITNAVDIVLKPSSTSINVTDTPPYVYDVKTKKINVQWSNNNTEVSYGVERIFTRHPDRFNPSSVNDRGVFVDMLRATFRTQFGIKPSPTFFAVGGPDTFYERNAVEQLEGFTSELFNSMKDKMIGPNLDKSGFVYRSNGSRLYNVSIKTDSNEKGQVLTFANELVRFQIPTLKNYTFPIYDGLTFPSMLFDKPPLNIFNSDFCNPIRIDFKKHVSMFGGIKLHQYKVRLIDFNNCTNPSDENTCPEVDKLDVTKCISASLPEKTIFLSKAHFYGSNNKTIEQMNINGFRPTEENHDSYVYFEPYTGTPFQAVYRMQLNIDTTIDPMRQSDYGSALEWVNLKGVRRLLPLFWIDQEVNISDKIISRLKVPLFVLYYGQYGIMALAIVLSIVFIILMEYFGRRGATKVQYKRAAYI